MLCDYLVDALERSNREELFHPPYAQQHRVRRDGVLKCSNNQLKPPIRQSSQLYPDSEATPRD